jgi:mono/diheme cytochrome c family protein
VRRLALLALLVVVAGGCSKPGNKVVTPTPTTVIGTIPKPPAQVTGNAAAGKAVFVSSGCGACHTFTPAGSKGTVGPDLDKLPEYAKAANRGSLEDFVKESITDPGAYVAPGYPNGVMPGTYGGTLSAQQLADLVAFLTQSP